jgi:hypothetical protein
VGVPPSAALRARERAQARAHERRRVSTRDAAWAPRPVACRCARCCLCACAPPSFRSAPGAFFVAGERHAACRHLHMLLARARAGRALAIDMMARRPGVK